MKFRPLCIFFLLLLGCGREATAQYYYRDVVSILSTRDQFQLYRKEKIGRILLNSTEAGGAPSEGFQVEQQINSSYSQLKTLSNSPVSGKSSMINYFNGQSQLYRTVDSSETAVSVYDYQYNSNGQPSMIMNTSRALGEKARSVETHNWEYNVQGKPVRMVKIKDGADSTEIRLTVDDKGNVIEEQEFRRNVAGEKIFYYYDSQNRLTDIVRFYDKLGRLIPDYTFDYTEDGRLGEMMVVQNGGRDYLTWKYEYLGSGLKSRESCYNKQKALQGRVEYTYESRK